MKIPAQMYSRLPARLADTPRGDFIYTCIMDFINRIKNIKFTHSSRKISNGGKLCQVK